MISARFLRDAARGGRVDKRRQFGRVWAGTDSISHLVHPGWHRLQVRPRKVWARRWAYFAPFLIIRRRVKGFGVDIGVGILAGGDSAGVGCGRKLYFVPFWTRFARDCGACLILPFLGDGETGFCEGSRRLARIRRASSGWLRKLPQTRAVSTGRRNTI